jgi:hypothetical protein
MKMIVLYFFKKNIFYLTGKNIIKAGEEPSPAGAAELNFVSRDGILAKLLFNLSRATP